MFLGPGASPMGFRLPIQSLLWYKRSELDATGYARDAFAERPALPLYHRLRERTTAYEASIVRQYVLSTVGVTTDSYGSTRGDNDDVHGAHYGQGSGNGH